MNAPFQDKTVIVGGSTGVGLGAVQAVLEARASVIVANIWIVTASFAALKACSKALAVKLGPIRVDKIRPGFIDSEMWNSAVGQRVLNTLRNKRNRTFPAHGLGEIRGIGQVAVFLMINRYVTGSVRDVARSGHMVNAS